jgi:hypothetical protein
VRGLSLAVLLAGIAVPSPAAESGAKALLSWTAPPGWKKSEYANAGGADPVVAYESDLGRIQIRVFGAPGSFYRTPEAFMAGPAATSMGRAPELTGRERVAGRDAAVYRREYPLADGDPHAHAPDPRTARECFCVLPPSKDGRFVVLSYSRESPAPDPSGAGEKAWKAFLAGASRARKAGPK